MNRTTKRLRLLALGLLLVAPLAHAQITGTILGLVHDASGAVVPNAKVTITNQGTGDVRTAVTSGTGLYTVTLLPVGHYTLRVEAPGFQTVTQQGIELQINQNARIDVGLKPGSVQQEVEVVENASQVESTVATVGKVVAERNVVDLPLNGRNFLQLGVLQPGVNPITPNLAKSGSGAAADQGFNVNGLRTQANIFMVDGGLDTDLFFTSSVLKPPPDAIQEFRILTNSYSPEFWGGGSVVNVITRSGTNNLHGAVWEFLRNDVFDAKNFFSTTTPPLKQNQFGASVGGPVYLPRIYNGRNRTFFFVYYEGFRNRQGITQNAGVPTPLERQGDFSQSPVKPIDPATGQPFAGPVPINPIAAKLLALYPVSGGRTFSSSPALQDDHDGFGVKIDQHFGATDTLSGSYLRNKIAQVQPFVPFGATVPGFPGLATQYPQTVSLAETHVFTAHLLNDARVSFVRLNFGSPLFTRRDKLSDFALAYASTAPDFETVPVIQVTGLSSLGNPQGPGIRVTNTYEFRDALSYSRGKHDAKAGVDIRDTQYNIIFGGGMSGQFTFTGQFTKVAFADFLLGKAASFSQGTIGGGHLRGRTYEGYVQDNYKLRSNLTLNLGARYTYASSYRTISTDLFAAFRPGQQSQVRPDAPVGLVYQGDPGVPPGTVNGDANNIAPRIGIAWSPFDNAKTTIRAGYGVFYEYAPGIAWFNAAFSSPPGRPSFSTTSPPNFANPLAGQPNPFGSRTIKAPVGLTVMSPNLVLPYDQQWNLSFQRELPGDVLWEVDYIGTHGVKLLRFNQVNPAVYNPGTALCPAPVNAAAVNACVANTNKRRIFAPNFTGITQVENTAGSVYHSLQASLNKRFHGGLSFLASYTWSHAIDDGSFLNISQGTNAGNVNAPESPSNLRLDRGNSLYDVRHRFVLSGVYDLPFGRGLAGLARELAAGWQINWILTLQTGTPLTVFEPRDISLTGVGADRPNVIGDPNAGPRKVQEWFNIAAFQRLDPVLNAGQFGNEGRDIISGPGYKNLDFSVTKRFTVTERTAIQFRAESFNLFNHPNFNLPDGNIGSPTFGQILEARDPRIMQFALKVLF